MKTLWPLLILSLVLSSCQIDSKRTESGPSARSEQPGKIDPRYSLSEDRSQFDRLRSEVAPDQQRRNDEKALFIEWMGEVRMEPGKIREKYDSLVRKKRELFNKDMAKIREDYSKIERKNKADFAKELEAEREAIKRQKITRDARNERFDELDARRKDFYSAQREKRDEFESDFREKRKDFDDYLKERNDEFNTELKSYTVRFRDATAPQK